MNIITILGKDICFYLLQFVDTKDISSLAKVNKFFNKLIKRKYSHVNSWKKIKKEIGKGDYYALILAQKYREFSLNGCLYAACRGGSLTLVKEMLKIGADDTLYGIYKAGKGGHCSVLNYIFKKEDLLKRHFSEHWDYALEGACISGHEFIIEKLIKRCYGGIVNYKYLIEGIFLGNNIEFLKYIPEDIHIPTEYWDRALYGAAHNNSLSLINLVLEKGATNMQEALVGACNGGHLNLIKNLVDNYSYEWNWNNALFSSCKKAHKNIINYIMDNHKCNVNLGLAGACYGGKLEIIEYMVSKGANYWHLALRGACRGRKFHIVKMICEEKIKYLDSSNIRVCINSCAKNKETRKYLKSVLKKNERIKI